MRMGFLTKISVIHHEACHHCRDTSRPASDWLWLLLVLLAIAAIFLASSAV